MEKAYQPQKYEVEIRELWDKNHSFALGSNTPAPDAQPFTIIMPPPNANGSLHAGHLMYVVEDIMTRYARMQGRPTLWQPGTDHAGTETQFVFEKKLAEEGRNRHDLGPDKFFAEVWDFVEEHKGAIVPQMQAMGFSADWEKLKYTLDEDIIQIVLATFKKLHDDGYIYRGNRIVNWDPATQSAYADIEIKHVEREGEIFTLDYGTVQIATTRPETIFADVAIAVNPDDARFASFIGKTATIPLVDRAIPIIADDHVDPSFGTGALKVTPGHDKNDYEIGLRHNLPQLTVIDFAGNMINVPEQYAGLTVDEARQAVVADLESAGKLVARTTITHSVAVQDRSGAVIEPLITEQWFMRMAELNKPVIKAIETDQVKIYPKRFKKIALDWLKNEHDWCISRQNWWGIRMPVYYKTSHDPEKSAYLITSSETEAREYYGEGNYRAETDTFDTWFSSCQWPYATLMTSLGEKWQDHYPTTVMATARDILHKWVTRMILFSLYKTSEVPFENVYLWGMVTDEKGQKLSKSKGNYTDPLDITAEYGTDALRLALSIGITPGNDGKLSEEKIKGYRNFCNKLWNVARFTLEKSGNLSSLPSPTPQTPADHWMLQKLAVATDAVTKYLETYRFSEAGETIYHLLWDDLADCYIEYSKHNLNISVLTTCLDTILRLLHPFAPFASEAIWQQLPWTDSQLIIEHWADKKYSFESEQARQFASEIITIKTKNDTKKQLESAQKEIIQKAHYIEVLGKKLANPAFCERAPRELVAQEQAKLDDAKIRLKELTQTIDQLKDTTTS